MKFKKFSPNDYVMVVKNGKTVREGIDDFRLCETCKSYT